MRSAVDWLTPSSACASFRVIEGCSAKNRRVSSSREWEAVDASMLFDAGSFASVAVKFALGRTISNALFVAMICGWGRTRVSSHDFPHSRAIRFDELQAVEDVGQVGVPAGGDAHHQVFQLKARQKVADGHEFDSIVLGVDQRTGVEGVVPVHERIQQGLANGGLWVVRGVGAQQLLESCIGLVG